MADDDQITLPPSTEEPSTISFDPVDKTPQLSTAVANQRASKANIGFQNRFDTGELLKQIREGREDDLRASIASKVDVQRQQQRQALITQKVNQQGYLTEDDFNNIDNQMFKDDVFDGRVDPKSVFENHFASEYIKTLNWPMGEEGPHWYKEAVAEIPQQVQQMADDSANYVKQYEYVLTRVQNIQAKIEARTVPQQVGAFALGLIPFRQSILERGNVPYSGLAVTTSGALEAQAQALLYQPDWKSFQTRFDTVMDNLENHDLDTALDFGKAILGQPPDEQLRKHVGDLLDISNIPAGKVSAAILAKAALYNATKTAFKDTARSVHKIGDYPIRAAAADGAGDLSSAATIRAADAIINPNPEKEAVNAMAAALRPVPQAIRDTPGRAGQEIANRIAEQADTFYGRLLNIIQDRIKVERIPEILAARRAVDSIKETMRGQYVRLDNHIISQGELYWDEFANEYRSNTYFGQYDATPFVSKMQTEVWAKQAGLSGGKPVQQGAGWLYAMPQPVREREANWLRNVVNTANTDIPNSMLQAYTGWLGWLRTPEETLSALDNWNRKAVIYGQSLLKNLYKEKAESLGKLYYGTLGVNRVTRSGRLRTEQFERTLAAAVDHWDPDIAAADRTPMNKGYWFKNTQELEHFYQTNFHRFPDPIEIQAYFDSVQMHDMDWVVRNLELHKKMTAEGVMEFRISALKSPAGNRHFSDFFPGIKRQVLPAGDEIVLKMGDHVGEERIRTAAKIGVKERKEVNDGIKTGEWQLIELDNANHLPLANFGGLVRPDDRIQYVLAKGGAFRERPLSFNQLPKRGGGHVDYDYNGYIKQAKILPQVAGKSGRAFQHVYVGDATVMGHSGPEIAGKNMVGLLNEARDHLRAGRETDAMAVINRTPIPWRDFKSWFNASAYTDSTGNTVKVPARLALDQPFHFVSKDKRVIDMLEWKDPYLNVKTGKTTFVDGTRSGSPAMQRGVEYAQQRDAYELMGLTSKGTRYNPLFEYGPANRVDPLTTLNRGLKRIINSSYMDDYKATAVNNWLEQAYQMGVFDPGKATLNQIRSSPFWAFHNADQLYKKGFNRTSGDYHRLEIARKQTLAFVGEFSPIDAWVNNIQSKMENTIYGGGLGKLAVVPYYGIPAIRQAGRYLRAAVYHSTIGLFNWVQYLVQNMTYSTILGIAGPNAAYHGWLGATLHNFGRFAGLANKDVGTLLDRIAGRMGGWKPGELIEARQLLAKTGFDFVGGEHVMMDHMLHPKIFMNFFGKFLDAGQLFFKAGERHARYGAWFTAYKEFRNGLGPWAERGPQRGNVSNLQLLEILNRADLLSGNMTTASKSLLQKGPFEFTTQFLGYTLRLTEQMTGKRLTKTEKTRLFATNALLFGIPAATGLFGFPFTDMFRQEAINHHYIVGDHWYNDVLMNGLPAFVGAVVSGEGDPSAGTYYNIGDRLGNPGLDIVREAMYGDKPFTRIMSGAAGSSVIDGWTQLSGFMRTAKSFVTDGGESFPYTFDDVMDGARIIYSINHAYGGFLAWNTGVVRSRKDTPIEPTSPSNAIWQAITGLSSQQAADFPRFKYDLDTEKQMQHDALAQFTKEIHRAMQSMADKDYNQASKYFARAKGILDAANYPVGERAQAYVTATDNKDLNMKINWDYYMRNVPAGEEASRLADYARQLQIRQQRIHQ